MAQMKQIIYHCFHGWFSKAFLDFQHATLQLKHKRKFTPTPPLGNDNEKHRHPIQLSFRRQCFKLFSFQSFFLLLTFENWISIFSLCFHPPAHNVRHLKSKNLKLWSQFKVCNWLIHQKKKTIHFINQKLTGCKVYKIILKGKKNKDFCQQYPHTSIFEKKTPTTIALHSCTVSCF